MTDHDTGVEGIDDPLGPPADDELGGASGAGDPAAADATGGEAPSVDRSGASVEELIADLEQATAERNEYLEALRRTQADFENYRKRVTKQSADDAARGAETLVDRLLPVLDACDAAVHHGATEVEPIYAALLGTLEKEGLERIDPQGEPFDPHRHEAVMHEPAADDDHGSVVSDVMRPGYQWQSRVLRPAMVKVRG